LLIYLFLCSVSALRIHFRCLEAIQQKVNTRTTITFLERSRRGTGSGDGRQMQYTSIKSEVDVRDIGGWRRKEGGDVEEPAGAAGRLHCSAVFLFALKTGTAAGEERPTVACK
jgi:hypothetical protein